MTAVRRLILFNQVTGPLFRQLAEGLGVSLPGGLPAGDGAAREA
jgi:hypothetical protein